MNNLFIFVNRLTASQTNWSTIEKKETFAIYHALQKLGQYLFDSELVIRTDHKPVKYIMDSPVENRKIQHWTKNICGNSCKTEYIEGKKNVCADMLWGLPHRPLDRNDDNELIVPDITDNMFEISMINSTILILRHLLNMTIR